MTRRRGQGEGGIERLPSGKYRAVVCSFVNGERHRASKSFATKADALAWLRARLAEKAAAGADDIATTLRTYAHVMPGMQEQAAGMMEQILGAGGEVSKRRGKK